MIIVQYIESEHTARMFYDGIENWSGMFCSKADVKEHLHRMGFALCERWRRKAWGWEAKIKFRIFDDE